MDGALNVRKIARIQEIVTTLCECIELEIVNI